jgi:hypothetical protein
MTRQALILATVALAAAGAVVPARAQESYRRANLIPASDPGQGRCTVSVLVDRVADVEIRGDAATLRDVSGRTPQFQRFECTGPIPQEPVDMGIRAIDGNGRMTLTRDSYIGGVAMVRVTNDTNREGTYTFDVYWNDIQPQVTPPPSDYSYSYGDADRASMDDDAIQACRSSAENRIRSEGYRRVRFGTANVNPQGSNEMVTGSATADRDDGMDSFGFTCRVNQDGQVRRLDLRVQ